MASSSLSKPEIRELRMKVALSCRILAHFGLVRDIIGHVSARIPGTDEMLIRCRGEDEYGLAFTTPGQVRRTGLSGGGRGVGKRHTVPLELPIHGEAYRARADVGAVVHAHPKWALLCGLSGVPLRPIIGAFDPYSAALGIEGVPVFPKSNLIDNPAIAADLVASLGQHTACIMRGHGITVVGDTVEQATIRAIKLEALAEITWRLVAAKRDVADLSPEELAAFAPRPGGGVIPGGERWLWRHYVRLVT